MSKEELLSIISKVTIEDISLEARLELTYKERSDSIEITIQQLDNFYLKSKISKYSITSTPTSSSRAIKINLLLEFNR